MTLAETIEFIRNADIKLWVLTGDKVDTAKNIGYSSRLLAHNGMDVLEYPKHYPDMYQATQQLRNQQKETLHNKKKSALVVDGPLLAKLKHEKHENLKTLVEIYDIVHRTNYLQRRRALLQSNTCTEAGNRGHGQEGHSIFDHLVNRRRSK